MYPATFFPKSIIFTYDLTGKVLAYRDFPSPFNITSCTRNFQYWAIAPLVSTSTDSGFALLGELNKIIPVSETRFTQISQVGPFNFAADVVGAPGEVVVISVYVVGLGTVQTVTCNMPSSGTAVLYLPELVCGSY